MKVLRNMTETSSSGSSSKMITATVGKFDVEKFNGKNNFGMWQCEVLDVLAQQPRLREGVIGASLHMRGRTMCLFITTALQGLINRWYAKTLYKSVVEFIGSSDSELDVRFIECPTTLTPQQVNGYECDLYVTAIAKVIYHWLENGGRSENGADLGFSNVKLQVGTASVCETRKEILRLVRSLMVKE